MNKERESLCCKEIEQLILLLDGMEAGSRPDCITEQMFASTGAVLTVPLYSHHHRYGTSDVHAD